MILRKVSTQIPIDDFPSVCFMRLVEQVILKVLQVGMELLSTKMAFSLLKMVTHRMIFYTHTSDRRRKSINSSKGWIDYWLLDASVIITVWMHLLLYHATWNGNTGQTDPIGRCRGLDHHVQVIIESPCPDLGNKLHGTVVRLASRVPRGPESSIMGEDIKL